MSGFKPQTGAIEWYDLTVKNADKITDSYSNVVGWDSSPVEMSDARGKYNDFNITFPDSKETVTWICHARGENSNIPTQWLMYVRVKGMTESAEACNRQGGIIIEGSRAMGPSRF